MRIRDKNGSAFGVLNKEFLESARAYLSDAFPNPDRAGCPPDSTLRSLAFNPRENDATVTEHLAACSPCFRRYSALLAELKVQQELEKSRLARAYAWLRAHPMLVGTALVCVLFLAIGVGLFLRGVRQPNMPPIETHNPRPTQPPNPTVAYVPFSLNLSALSPVRGTHNADLLRKLAVLFASTMDHDLRTYRMDRFKALGQKELERLLYPLLRADDRPTAEKMLSAVSPLLATVLDHERESSYLEAMVSGKSAGTPVPQTA
jgi:hypothetical protein